MARCDYTRTQGLGGIPVYGRSFVCIYMCKQNYRSALNAQVPLAKDEYLLLGASIAIA